MEKCNEYDKTGSFVDLMQSYDLFSLLSDYIFRPAYSLYKGFREGQAEAEEYILNLDKEIDQRIVAGEAKERADRMDDLNYEMGKLQYKKSAVELDRMLNPLAKKTQKKQPKVSMNYKEYCCD